MTVQILQRLDIQIPVGKQRGDKLFAFKKRDLLQVGWSRIVFSKGEKKGNFKKGKTHKQTKNQIK